MFSSDTTASSHTSLPARNNVTERILARLTKLYLPNVGEETLYEKSLGGFLSVILGSATLQEKSVCASCSERRKSPFNEPDREWSLAETLYALAPFYSLFFGAYTFFGWYYSP